MRLYANHICPYLIDLGMRNKETARLRATWIPHACGEVLEIGIGSGLNLRYYSSEVRRVYGVDPSLELQRMARQRVVEQLPVEFITQSAEQTLPLPDASMDTVVVTWTLCSIPDATRALDHMRRALKRSGRLIFLEHGRAADPRVVAWQDRLTPLWRRFSGGCHLNRKIDDLISSAGFRITDLQTCYLHGPHFVSFTYQGFAQPM